MTSATAERAQAPAASNAQSIPATPEALLEPDGSGGFRLDVEMKREPGETRLPKPPLP